MKFISIFEEQSKLINEDLKYTLPYQNIEEELKKTKFILFFDAFELGYDLDKVRNESTELINDFNALIDVLDKNVSKKSLIVDTSSEASGNKGGGFGEDLIPDFMTAINIAFIFVIIQSATGFFGEAGKDFYLFIKKNTKKLRHERIRHAYVILRGNKNEAKFLFQSSFNQETFEIAWKSMLQTDVDSLKIEKFEERIFVYDTAKNKWVIFN